MKKILKKHWALIGLIIAFIVDHSFDILIDSGMTATQVDIFQGLGVLLVGYFWNPKPQLKSIHKTTTSKEKGAIIPNKGL